MWSSERRLGPGTEQTGFDSQKGTSHLLFPFYIKQKIGGFRSRFFKPDAKFFEKNSMDPTTKNNTQQMPNRKFFWSLKVILKAFKF